MKNLFVCFLLIMFFFTGCGTITQSEAYSSALSTDDSSLIGESGLTELEIKDIFSEKLDKYAEVWFWIVTCPFQDFDESMPVYPDVDAVNPEGFDWVAVNRYKTRKEMYDDFETVHTQKFVDFRLSFWFGKQPDLEDTGSDWLETYNPTFKEIESRLYRKRTSDFNEEIKKELYNYQTISIVFENKEMIVVELETQGLSSYLVNVSMIKESGIWKLPDIPTYGNYQ